MKFQILFSALDHVGDAVEFEPEYLPEKFIEKFKLFVITKEPRTSTEATYAVPKKLRRLETNEDGTPKLNEQGEPVIYDIVVGYDYIPGWLENGYNHRIEKHSAYPDSKYESDMYESAVRDVDYDCFFMEIESLPSLWKILTENDGVEFIYTRDEPMLKFRREIFD